MIATKATADDIEERYAELFYTSSFTHFSPTLLVGPELLLAYVLKSDVQSLVTQDKAVQRSGFFSRAVVFMVLISIMANPMMVI